MTRRLACVLCLVVSSPVWAIKAISTTAETDELTAITSLLAHENTAYTQSLKNLSDLFDAARRKIDNEAEKAKIEKQISASGGRDAVRIFGLTAKEEARLKHDFNEQIRKLQQHPSAGMLSLQYVDSGSITASEAAKSAADAEFWSGALRGGELAASVAAANQTAAEAARRTQALEDERARREAKNADWTALRAWAQTACAYLKNYPDIIQVSPDNHLDAKTWEWISAENERRKTQARASNESMRSYLLRHLVVLPRAHIDAGLRDPGAKLDSCQRDIIEALRDADGPVDTVSLVARLDHEKGGGALGVVVRGVAGAIRSGATAIVDGIAAPFISSPSTDEAVSPHGERDADGSSQREDRAGRNYDIEKLPMRQLRGIGSWKGL